MSTNTQEPDAASRPAVNLGALCVVGKVREENQDRMLQLRLPIGDLCVVADGMGGHQGGATAATIAVETIERVFREAGTSASPLTTIQTAIREANGEIHNRAETGKPEFEKMGSTAVVVLIKDGVAHVGHVGDSRAYLVRDGQLTQLTEDHTVVQGLVDAGVLTQEEALEHEDASKLTRVLGPKPDVDIDLEPPIALGYGDAILLCSDGLSGYVRDPEIQRAIAEGGRAQKVAEHLVDLAMQAGGEDNISVQFVRYGDAEREQEGTELEKPDDTGHGGRAWKVAGSLAAAAVFGSAGTFAYLSLRTPPPPVPPAAHAAAADGTSGVPVLPGPLPSDAIQRLQTEIKALTARVERLEASAKSATPRSDGKAGGGNPGKAAPVAGSGRNKREEPVRPAAPASGAQPGAEAGANHAAGSADQGRNPEPTQKTDPSDPSKGDPNQGGAAKGDATKRDVTKGEPGKGESKKLDPEGKKQ